jgi:hypothetical protein
MTSSELLLNLGVLAMVLATNVGVHPIVRERFTRPVIFMGLAALLYLKHMPTQGNDFGFELLGAAAGLGLGVLAATLSKVETDERGRLVTRAGAAFAALWITVVGARIAFAYGSDRLFPHAIVTFSRAHDITSSEAWVAMFVLMAFGMVTGRLAVLALQASQQRLSPATAR